MLFSALTLLESTQKQVYGDASKHQKKINLVTASN